jgi:two-component system sensor histidine kinase RegB
LVRLRWLALLGQLLVVAGIEALLAVRLPWPWIAVVFGAEALSNLVCAGLAKRRPVTEAWLVVILALDVLLLTALLHMTGGPVNPFTFLYLVHIALAAVTLRPVAAWGLTALGLVAFGLLFALPAWPGFSPHEGNLHHDHLWLHLQGMYVAFGVSAVFIVYFVQRVREALAEREKELAAARDLTARQAKFAALATMAAGAAHELGTPLSTIAVAAKEVEKRLANAAEPIQADIRLIREQVRRCQRILHQMAAEAGQGVGEGIEAVPATDLASVLAAESPSKDVPVFVELDVDDPTRRIFVSRQAMARALRNLVRNAVQASPPGAAVHVRFSLRGPRLEIEVADRGRGMAPEVLSRAGEPFFTTKEPGEGIGLGLFLTRTLVEQMGGTLEVQSALGQGTTARIVLPAADATNRHVANPVESATDKLD